MTRSETTWPGVGAVGLACRRTLPLSLLTDGFTVGVMVRVGVRLGVPVGVYVGPRVSVAVGVAVAPSVSVLVAVWVDVVVGVTVRLDVRVGVCVKVDVTPVNVGGVIEVVRVVVGVAVGVGVQAAPAVLTMRLQLLMLPWLGDSSSRINRLQVPFGSTPANIDSVVPVGAPAGAGLGKLSPFGSLKRSS